MQTTMNKSEQGWSLHKKEAGLPEVLTLESNGILKYSEDPAAPEKEVLEYLSEQLKNITVLVVPPCSTVTINCILENTSSLEGLIVADWNTERFELWKKQAENLKSAKLNLVELPADTRDASAVFAKVLKKHHQGLSLGKGAVYIPRRFRRLDRELSEFLEETVLRLQQEACSSAAFRTTRSWHITINRLLNMQLEKTNRLKVSGNHSPVVIVGAGPSLDYTVATLAKYSDRAVIIAVDASVRTLMKHGIVPDLIASLDDSDICWRFFAEHLEILKTVPLAMTMEGSNVLAVNYPGQKIFFRDTGTPSWLKPFCLELPCIDAGQCVGHFAFHIAEYLEPSEIIMTGFDLGFRGDSFHVENSAVPYYEVMKDSFEYIEVDSVDGGKILTDLSMSFYLKYFEDKIRTCKCPVIDATEGGALIRGTELSTLQDALKNLPEKEVFSLERISGNSSGTAAFIKQLVPEISEIKRKLESAEQASIKMTSEAVKNPLAGMPLGSDAFEIAVACCNSLLLTEFSKISRTYSKDDFLSYKQLLLDTLKELKYSFDFILSFLSAAAYEKSGNEGSLILTVDEEEPEFYPAGTSPVISASCDLPLPELWDYIRSAKVDRVICLNGNVIPDVWLVPGIQCLDIKTCFDPHEYEKSLWLPGYRVVTCDEKIYRKWREYLPGDIACELLEESEICLN